MMGSRKWNVEDVEISVDEKDKVHLKTKTRDHHMVVSARYSGKLTDRQVKRAAQEVAGLRVARSQRKLYFSCRGAVGSRQDGMTLINSFVKQLEIVLTNNRHLTAVPSPDGPPSWNNTPPRVRGQAPVRR